MKAKQEENELQYEVLYDENYNRFYKEYIDTLETLLKTDDGVSAKNKLSHYRNKIIKEYWDLFRVNPIEVNSPNDKFSERLNDTFKTRETDYSRDYIKLFFKIGVCKLLKEYTDIYEKIEKSKVAYYNEKGMLIFLAKAFGLKRLIDGTDSWTYLASEEILLRFEKLKASNSSIGHVNSVTPINKTEEMKLTLSAIFVDAILFDEIISLLAANRFCNGETKIWTDTRKSSKSTFVAIIKLLHHQGYFKLNTKLLPSDIVEIAYNTFNLKLSISVCSHSTPEKAQPGLLAFIPSVTELRAMINAKNHNLIELA